MRAQDDGEEVFAFGRLAVHPREAGIAAAAIGVGRLVESDVQPIARVIAVNEVLGDRLTVLPAGGDAQVRQRQQSYPHQPLLVHVLPLFDVTL